MNTNQTYSVYGAVTVTRKELFFSCPSETKKVPMNLPEYLFVDDLIPQHAFRHRNRIATAGSRKTASIVEMNMQGRPYRNRRGWKNKSKQKALCA